MKCPSGKLGCFYTFFGYMMYMGIHTRALITYHDRDTYTMLPFVAWTVVYMTSKIIQENPSKNADFMLAKC